MLIKDKPLTLNNVIQAFAVLDTNNDMDSTFENLKKYGVDTSKRFIYWMVEDKNIGSGYYIGMLFDEQIKENIDFSVEFGFFEEYTIPKVIAMTLDNEYTPENVLKLHNKMLSDLALENKQSITNLLFLLQDGVTTPVDEYMYAIGYIDEELIAKAGGPEKVKELVKHVIESH